MYAHRIYEFSKRHKWKLFSVVTAGTGCLVILKSLYKKYKSESELWNLFLSSQDPDYVFNKIFSKFNTSENEWIVYFFRNQNLSDSTVHTALYNNNANSVYDTLKGEFDCIFEYTRILRDPSTLSRYPPNEKSLLFKEMGLQIISRTISAIWVCIASILCYRVQMNLIANRTIYNTDPKYGDAVSCHNENFIFLTSLRHLATLEYIHSVSRVSIHQVNVHLGSQSPQDLCSIDFILGVFKSCLDEMINKSEFVEYLLPKRIKADSFTTDVERETYIYTAESVERIEYLLNEARDFIDAPQFLMAFEACIDQSIEYIREYLCGSLFDGQVDKVASLAKYYGQISKFFDLILLSELSNNMFFKRISQLPKVIELSAIAFFPESIDSVELNTNIKTIMEAINHE